MKVEVLQKVVIEKFKGFMLYWKKIDMGKVVYSMGEKQSEKDNSLLVAQINYYVMREIYKPATGKTNLDDFYKSVKLNKQKYLSLIDGSETSIPNENNFTTKLSKDTGISLNVILGRTLITMPENLKLEDWEGFFLHDGDLEMVISRYMVDMNKRLEVQYKNLNIENKISRLDNADITDGFKWYYYLRTGTHYQPAKLSEIRLKEFKQALEMMDTKFWKDCPDDTRKKCISEMQKQLKAAMVIQEYIDMFGK